MGHGSHAEEAGKLLKMLVPEERKGIPRSRAQGMSTEGQQKSSSKGCLHFSKKLLISKIYLVIYWCLQILALCGDCGYAPAITSPSTELRPVANERVKGEFSSISPLETGHYQDIHLRAMK